MFTQMELLLLHVIRLEKSGLKIAVGNYANLRSRKCTWYTANYGDYENIRPSPYLEQQCQAKESRLIEFNHTE